MTGRPVWAREVGGLPRTHAEHAEVELGCLKTAVRTHSTDAARDKAIAARLSEVLAQAYAAGVREGRSDYQAQAGHLIRDQVMRAFQAVALEPAQCPHCLGRGCVPCGNVGKRPK